MLESMHTPQLPLPAMGESPDLDVMVPPTEENDPVPGTDPVAEPDKETDAPVLPSVSLPSTVCYMQVALDNGSRSSDSHIRSAFHTEG